MIEDLEGEIWLPVVGFEKLYKISNLGRVKSLDRTYEINGRWGKNMRTLKGKLYKPYTSDNGYYYTFLFKEGRFRFAIHRLVGIAFIPNPNNKPYINHIDCNPKNNNVSNLEWVTHAENAQHAYRNNRLYIFKSKGQDNGRAVLTNEQVIEIRRLKKEGMSISDLLKKFNIKKGTLEGVIYKTKWKHLL